MTAEAPKPQSVDMQLEFEAAQLLIIALKPLSRTARSRVISFVTSQLEEIDPTAAPRRRSLYDAFLGIGGTE